MRALMLTAALAAATPAVAHGQGPAPIAPAVAQNAPRPPQFGILAGFGNAMGWFGGQAERYFARGRLSLFVGLGYTPAVDPGDPSGATFAGGLRGYTGGARHRGFAELGVSQLVIVEASEDERLYGPGLQVGYQYMARRGFTMATSIGLGYTVGHDDVIIGSSRFEPLVGLGFGYTWR